MKPNIVFILSDQQRWDTLGCYGNSMGVTPNLDRMAEEGVRFEYAFTCQPVCGPARSCLQTGKYATETGCFKNQVALPPGEKTIAHSISASGYDLGYIGKWHLASGEDQDYVDKPVPIERRGGWNEYWLAADTLEFTSHGYDGHMFGADMNKVEFQGYRVDCLTDFALDYLRGRSREKPFFLFLSYLEPHHQNDRNQFEGPLGEREHYLNFKVPGDLEGMKGDWKDKYPDYLGCCASLDRNLGRIRDELDILGLSENTLVVYTSDHGCHFRTRNSEYKRSCHDGSIRIPMVACGPNFTGGRVINRLVSLIDIPPTLLTAAQANVPQTMRGRPLQQLLEDSPVDWPDEIFVQISEDHVGRAVRTKRWKYSVWVPADPNTLGYQQPGSTVYTEQCLYDLENDPHERCNLVSDPAYSNIRADLALTLKRLIVNAGEAEPAITQAVH